MSDHLTPLEVCERLIGIGSIAEVLGYDRSAPFGWRHPSSSRDAGDFPSARIQRRLLAYAVARQIPLTAEHLIWGASADEIEALKANHPLKFGTFASDAEVAAQ